MKLSDSAFLSGKFRWLLRPAHLLSMIILALWLGYPNVTQSATNRVTSLADNGAGSLRQLINDAAPGDTLVFDVVGTITLTGGELVISRQLSIAGPASSELAISGNKSSRVFRIAPGVSAIIADLTLCNGKAPDGAPGYVTTSTSVPGGPGESGGAILTAGTLTLLDCVVTNSFAGNGGDGASSMYTASAGGAGGAGGAIENSGSLSVSNCIISANSAGNAGRSAIATWQPPSGQGGSGGAIHNTGTLTLDSCVISGNTAGSVITASSDGDGVEGSSGGGVWNGGVFIARHCVFSANIAGTGGTGGGANPWPGSGGQGGFGGGIYSTGALALTECTVRENVAGNGGTGGGAYYPISGAGAGGHGGLGGGIFVADGALVGCSIISNRAGLGGPTGYYYTPGEPAPQHGGDGGGGGGIACRTGSLLLTNCTLVGNAAGDGYGSASVGGSGGSGGGLLLDGVYHAAVACTIVGNAAGEGGTLAPYPSGVPGPDGGGGGVYRSGAPGTRGILNTIIAKNTGQPRDVLGAFLSFGHNLVGVTNSNSGFTAPGDLGGTAASPLDPKLATLGDNGGPTLTVALLPGSPAVEAGAVLGLPDTDQRGVARPQGQRADIGAYELQFTDPVIIDARFLSASCMGLCSLGLPHQTYVLQASTNLIYWLDVTNAVANSSGVCHLNETIPADCTTRFYRIKSQAQ